MTTQESVAFTEFCHRVLFSIGEISEPEVVEVMLESDSSSALQLIQAREVVMLKSVAVDSWAG